MTLLMSLVLPKHGVWLCSDQAVVSTSGVHFTSTWSKQVAFYARDGAGIVAHCGVAQRASGDSIQKVLHESASPFGRMPTPSPSGTVTVPSNMSPTVADIIEKVRQNLESTYREWPASWRSLAVAAFGVIWTSERLDSLWVHNAAASATGDPAGVAGSFVVERKRILQTPGPTPTPATARCRSSPSRSSLGPVRRQPPVTRRPSSLRVEGASPCSTRRPGRAGASGESRVVTGWTASCLGGDVWRVRVGQGLRSQHGEEPLGRSPRPVP